MILGKEQDPGQWNSLNFNSLIKKLVTLKYQCLKASTPKGSKIDIDLSDVNEKFKKLNVNYKIVRNRNGKTTSR